MIGSFRLFIGQLRGIIFDRSDWLGRIQVDFIVLKVNKITRAAKIR
jgi:hypothetical protein